MTIIEETTTYEFNNPLLDELGEAPDPGSAHDGAGLTLASVGVALTLVVALAALLFVLVGPGENTAEVGTAPATEQVPSGSPFDAPIAPRSVPAEKVPSGSPFDAPLSARPDVTNRVPSGSPFDAVPLADRCATYT